MINENDKLGAIYIFLKNEMKGRHYFRVHMGRNKSQRKIDDF